MPGGRRSRLQGAPPEWSDVSPLLHMRIKDAAAELNVPTTYLRCICRQNKYAQWPGKKLRYLKRTGKKVMQEADPRDGPGLAPGPSQVSKTVETKEGTDMTRIHAPVANPPPAGEGIQAPVANPPPAKELITLNLIDKVGIGSSSSSSSER